jgi:copper chaperone CopZ
MKIVVMMILQLFVFSFAIGAQPATTVVKVNGMVCAFCSNSIEKKFKEMSEVKEVKVDLDTKLVTIRYNEGKSLSEKAINDLITKSGYTVVSVTDVPEVKQEAEQKANDTK